MLHTISPLDGRYEGQTKALQSYFSEEALMRYRIHVEVEYLIAMAETGLIKGHQLTHQEKTNIRTFITGSSDEEAIRIKTIEAKINHDVKAIEYFIKEKLDGMNLGWMREWVHFGLTSQDINNTAFPLMIREAYAEILVPAIRDIRKSIFEWANQTMNVPMLAHTHGQPATPTLFGKEMMVFVERLAVQLDQLEAIELKAKFGGATGNLNAHVAAFPKTDWHQWADDFTDKYLAIKRYRYTTQIEHYDQLAALCHATMRINTILVDFCRDIWTYISMQYITQKANPDEVGSSTMPHKVNPIDFENAEGNLGFANAIFGHLADKLPISRLQRDLTDSTVLRNIGVPVGHAFLAMTSIQKGLKKITVNHSKMAADLDANWAVLAEAMQTIMRREGVTNPYELLKDLTRGKSQITREDLHAFIEKMILPDKVKTEMKSLTPAGYVGMR